MAQLPTPKRSTLLSRWRLALVTWLSAPPVYAGLDSSRMLEALMATGCLYGIEMGNIDFPRQHQR